MSRVIRRSTVRKSRSRGKSEGSKLTVADPG